MTTNFRMAQTKIIVEVILRLLKNQNLLIPGRVAFYVWLRGKRAILIFDPLALRKPEAVIQALFVHRVSTALGGRRVIATNSRGIFLQVAYRTLPVIKLETQALDLSQQPSPLHIPIGQTKRGPLWLSIVDMDSVLIGGTRRMGKTNLIHTWILALLHGKAARLVLWDGKDGVEFGRYAKKDGVLVVNDLATGIQHLVEKMSHRKLLFQKAKVNSLATYNAKTKAKLSPLVLIVDEAALIPDDLQSALSHLIAVGGAYGIHPIIATQRPDAKAVQGMLKANLSTRIALPVPSHHDSQVILGRSGAEKLPKEKGRLLLVWNARLIEVQAYLAPLDKEPDCPHPQSLLGERELRLVDAAIAEDGWFRVREIANQTGESRDWVNGIAKRWESMGYLTSVQRNEKGHPQGRRLTNSLLETAGLGGQGDLADQADLALF
ncbi:MAG: FtsK/SpoIIIE domain-containing protein [Methanosarcinaceae archaeon]